MIAYLEGKLAYKDPTYVIIDVGGIGYQVKISLHTYALVKSEEKIRLQTYLHIKEDSHTLYGFYDTEEKSLFSSLISVSGVGPSTALMMLSSLHPSEIRQAILAEDVRTIQSIKGIGAKSAQRLILELKDKMKKGDGDMLAMSAKPQHALREEALAALLTLGYNKAVAEKAIDGILKRATAELKVEELIRQVLKSA
ncbi:Holliday junction branch migration protein RuvA [Cytophagales bacterium LB-30]|uniref:Holliday junction branch migration complex subunit RuvA n=1 Tax=Shiella aurantiaca TaxID=3058365 RepID=A0ABT8F2U0_9BACT|nr:Holliday junction branch migration protein RuvA [Shiella aurantiaca]MDN4164693.1 Holliday junction branch migration protein RuvA [Shiella aurantiaca]